MIYYRCSDEVNPRKQPYKFSNKKLRDLGLEFTPVKQCLYDTVKSLQEKGHLPIVTHHQDDSNQIQAWLSESIFAFVFAEAYWMIDTTNNLFILLSKHDTFHCYDKFKYKMANFVIIEYVFLYDQFTSVNKMKCFFRIYPQWFYQNLLSWWKG